MRKEVGLYIYHVKYTSNGNMLTIKVTDIHWLVIDIFNHSSSTA